MHRSVSLALAAGLLVALASALGCSGSADINKTFPDEVGGSPSSNVSEDSGSPGSPAAPPDGREPSRSNGNGSSSERPAGPPGTPLAKCVASQMEVEPNDDDESATPMRDMFCGELPSSEDVDHAAFTLRRDAQQIAFEYESSGPVRFTVTVKDETVPLFGANAPPVPFYPGERYLVTATSESSEPQTYRLVAVIR